MTQRTCLVVDCGRPIVARKLCVPHYARRKKTGDVRASDPVISHRPWIPGRADRFNSFVIRAGECFGWNGGLNKYGYGKFTWDGKTIGAHVAAWMLSEGPVPAGLIVCHHCDNPPCTRREHLYLGTPQDNMDDMSRKGRKKLGSQIATAKLTEADVRYIRSRVPGPLGTQAYLAEVFGVSLSAINLISRRKSWPHVA